MSSNLCGKKRKRNVKEEAKENDKSKPKRKRNLDESQKEKNRIMARENRKRKKAYIEGLEGKVSNLENEI